MIHIILPVYNSELWISRCIKSILSQSYQNYQIHIINDASTDTTGDKIKEFNDNRIFYTQNTNNIKSLANYYNTFHKINSEDDDIIVRLDGDDWFYHDEVLANLIKLYLNTDCWMTYGTWITYPENTVGTHMCLEIPHQVDKDNSFRQWGFRFSHLKTHRAWLFKLVHKKDLIDPTTNTFFIACDDLGYIFPMAEMSGKEHIILNPDINLVLNRENPLNEQKVMAPEVRRITSYITQQKPYNRL